MKSKSTIKNMTSGPVMKQMITFALPVFLGMLCQ